MRPFNYLKLLPAAALAISLSAELNAAQRLKLKQLEQIHGEVGIGELNRIAVTNDRIAELFAPSSLQLTFDEEAGQAFVQPTVIGPISISIKTESGIYQDMLLTSKAIPAQTIVIEGKGAPQEIVIYEQERSYVDLLTSMLKAMASGKDGHWNVKKRNKVIERWKDLSMNEIKAYEGRRFHGEVYELKNRSKRALHLSEKNFLETSDTAAIGLSSRQLLPGESGFLYRVKRHDKH